MSELHPDPALTRCHSQAGGGRQRIATRDADLSGLPLRRALPRRERRMIGAWCFLDHFGPLAVSPGGGMHVGPHPHIGLQTFSYLLEGELLHRDSLGSEQRIVPGQVNLMTAGRGISHTEHTPADFRGGLHGVQLWIALPDAQRHCEPSFQHIATPPAWRDGGWDLSLLAGEFAGRHSEADIHSPLMAMALRTDGASELRLPLNPHFEHGLLVLNGSVQVDGEALAPGTLLALDCGQTEIEIQGTQPASVLLIGGAPFEEDIVMWWNFVGRQQDEMVRATDDWNAGRGFGQLTDDLAAPIPAPITPWHRG